MDIRNLIHHDSALASTSSLFSSSYTSPSLPSTFPPPPLRPQLNIEPSQQTFVPSSFVSSSTKEDRAAAHGDPEFLSSAPARSQPPSRLSLASLLDSEPSRCPSSSTHRDADAKFMREEKAALLGPPRLLNSRTPSPVLSYSHSPASSSCSLQPPTPDSLPEYPTCFPRKRLIIPHSPPPSIQHQHQVSPTSALDLLAVVADISSAGPSSERSVSPRSDTGSLGDASSSSGSRKRVKMEEKEGEDAGVKRVTKKRKGRGLDPQKTRLMIFPPTLPPRSFAPAESEGYTRRPTTSAENLYAPTYHQRSRLSHSSRFLRVLWRVSPSHKDERIWLSSPSHPQPLLSPSLHHALAASDPNFSDRRTPSLARRQGTGRHRSFSSSGWRVSLHHYGRRRLHHGRMAQAL